MITQYQFVQWLKKCDEVLSIEDKNGFSYIRKGNENISKKYEKIFGIEKSKKK